MEKTNKWAAVGTITLVLALAVAAHSASFPQTVGGSAPPSLDRAAKGRIVEWIGAKLAEIYVFPDVAAKAAALLHSLVLNHPFIEGNKRVGAHAAALFLLANGVELTASAGALAEITLATARGELSAEALAIWFRQRSRAAGV